MQSKCLAHKNIFKSIKLPLAPNTNPTSLRINLFKSADEFLACLKSKEAALECPEPGGTLFVDRPLKSCELLLQPPDMPYLNSNEEFLECPKMNSNFSGNYELQLCTCAAGLEVIPEGLGI